MNDTRTYGVEMEYISTLSRLDISGRIQEKLRPMNHSCHAEGYVHNTDSHNHTQWSAKTDSSITTSAQYPYGVEVVSPVLRGEAGLPPLKAVCETIAPYSSINRSCGLHVHHGVRPSELKAIAKAWIRCEDQFFKIVPPSRRENFYCAKWSDRYSMSTRAKTGSRNVREPREGEPMREYAHIYIGERYQGLNLRSFWSHGTVEFRLHSGSFDFEKIKMWIIYTQAFLDRAAELSVLSNFATLQEYHAALTSPRNLRRRNTTTPTSRPVRLSARDQELYDFIVPLMDNRSKAGICSRIYSHFSQQDPNFRFGDAEQAWWKVLAILRRQGHWPEAINRKYWVIRWNQAPTQCIPEAGDASLPEIRAACEWALHRASLFTPTM
jgi:hypothetical protein